MKTLECQHGVALLLTCMLKMFRLRGGERTCRKPRVERSREREPKEHCLNLDDTNGSLSDISDSCNKQQSVEVATSPVSIGQSKLVDIMEANKTATKDILENVKLKLLEACSALQADCRTAMCTIEEIRANESKAARINFDCDIVKLNVGGQIFDTSMETFKKYGPNLFTQLFSGEGNAKKSADGAYFFDRDGIHFRHILNYMRHGNIPDYVAQQHKNELLLEAEFYGLNSLVDYLHNGDAASASIEKAKCIDEGSSSMSSALKSPIIIDEVVRYVNKACLLLDGDITNIAIREQQKCKADLCIPHEPNEIVKLNVGGVFFQTNLSTLMKDKDSLLFSLVTGRLESYQSNDGFFYIDRDGTRFKHILNFFRDGLIPQKVFCEMGEELMIEANFFEINSLKKALTLLQSKVSDKSIEQFSMKEDGDANIEGKNRKASRVLSVNPCVNLDSKVAEVTERIYQSITEKLDLLTMPDMLELASFKHGSVAEALSNFEIIHEKIDDMGILFADCFGEDSSKLIKDALADCKRVMENCKTRDKAVASDIANIKLQLNEAVLKFKDQSISYYLSCTNDIKEFVETLLQSAFEKHEDRMEIERIVHNHPALCAFSKSEILQDCSEYKAHLHKFLFETKNRGKIKLIYSWKQNGADYFHDICDNEPPTLILVEADNGNIFGGYTARYWNINTSEFFAYFSYMGFLLCIGSNYFSSF